MSDEKLDPPEPYVPGDRVEATKRIGSSRWHPAIYLGQGKPLGSISYGGGVPPVPIPRARVRFDDGSVHDVGLEQVRPLSPE
jgi:hypothetical protein